MSEFAIELEHISKAYGAVQANDDVTLRVRRGTIHGVVGENGAGKTTLMRVAYGFHRPDAGRITVNGTRVQLDSPSDALRAGIGMVHQHSLLVPSMTVLENILLATEQRVLGFAPARQRIRKLGKEYDLAIDPDARVRDLSVASRQRVEILKALYFEAAILILDEPTAVLTPQEARALFVHLEGFARQGKTIIIITHKLPEVMAVTSRVSVMRRGKIILESLTSDTDDEHLAHAMVGRSVALRLVRADETLPAAGTGAEARLRVVALNVQDDRGVLRVRDVDLEVAAGEIVGVAAVEGNGQSELVEAITGLRNPVSGAVWLDGHDLTTASPRDRRLLGMRHIPEDRLGRGVNGNASIAENLVAGGHHSPPIARRGLLDGAAIDRLATDAISRFSIAAAGPDVMVGTLSGGNMQKVVIARELDGQPRVVVAAQPTQGVDVGATEFIRQQLVHLRDEGAAVLLVSSELTEIMDLSDRVYVLFNGAVAGVVDRGEGNEELLGLMMMGAGPATADEAVARA
ncbi:MAG: ABC transporter ATP-binding protein [Chloroflexota bacterium]|nr:ABC transporter ATP-binding protein [Chloroflexota bacterium]